MESDTAIRANVKQAVPFFEVFDLDRSLHFYIDGLGFEMTNKWIDEGKLRWCWLQLGGAAVMLQEFKKEEADSPGSDATRGVGISIYFICEDALAIYRAARSRGIVAETPFVGNGMWVTGLTDPDGYRIYFESPTNEREGSIFTG